MIHNKRSSKTSFRRTAIAVTGVTIAIFATVVSTVSLNLREQIRQQIVERDAEALYPFAQLTLDRIAENNIIDGTWTDTDILLLETALETSQMKNVIGVRVFDATSNPLVQIPETLIDQDIAIEAYERATRFETSSHYYPETEINAFFETIETNEQSTSPILEVTLPLHHSNSLKLLGVAQYLIDARSIASEFSALDKNLGSQAGTAFLAGSTLLGLILMLSFRHLRGVNELLEERSRRLAQANADLSLAAKTSAIGTVTAHLLHGLKNPLSNLQLFVNQGKATESDVDWNIAANSANRMQQMIQEMVTVIREEETGTQFDFTLDEIRECIFTKAQPLADKSDLTFSASKAPDGEIDNHRGNLLLLTLMNLIENAIEATPVDGKISLNISQTTDDFIFTVTDTGKGIPQIIRENLFNPVQSSKQGGSGIGLAISSQLAKQIGGELSLEQSDSNGSSFSISLKKNPQAHTPPHAKERYSHN